MFPLPFAPLLLAGNALIDREPWAAEQLQRHAGKVVALHLDSRREACRIDARGRLVAAGPDATAAVQVYLATRDLPRLLRGHQHERLQAVRIEGEAGLTHTLSELASHLRPDIEDELARWVGDVAARRMVQLARQGWQRLTSSNRALQENLAEYAVHEANYLPARADVEQWQHHVQQLDERTRQLLNRAAALQATLRSLS